MEIRGILCRRYYSALCRTNLNDGNARYQTRECINHNIQPARKFLQLPVPFGDAHNGCCVIRRLQPMNPPYSDIRQNRVCPPYARAQQPHLIDSQCGRKLVARPVAQPAGRDLMGTGLDKKILVDPQEPVVGCHVENRFSESTLLAGLFRKFTYNAYI
jgi:hypothetical protein